MAVYKAMKKEHFFLTAESTGIQTTIESIIQAQQATMVAVIAGSSAAAASNSS